MITITGITPPLGSVGKDIVLELTGSGFLTTTVVKLVSPAIDPITYNLVGELLISSTAMRATIPANSVPIGFYDVLVENNVDDVVTVTQAYRVGIDLPVAPFLTNNTADNIRNRILARIGNAPNGKPYDTRRGQVPYDMALALAPGFERIYKRMDDLLPQGFAQYMGGVLLDLRAEEHGVLRKPSQFSQTVLEVTGTIGAVVPTGLLATTTVTPNSGDQSINFESVEPTTIVVKAPLTSNVTYATETSLVDSSKAWVVDEWQGYSVLITLGFGAGQLRKIVSNTATTLNVTDWESGTIPDVTSQYKIFTGVEVRAQVAGVAGNVVAGAVNRLSIPITFITGVSNPVAATGGLNTESDKDLLSRYLLFVRSRSTGGNDTDYEQWARETPAVNLGEVSVIEEWDGYGTVKVVIINSDSSIPDVATVGRVYDYIQTKRPIGANVTVEAAAPVDIEANFTLTVQEGFSLATVGENARQAIVAYLNSVRVGGVEGFILFYRVQQAALEDVEGIETFDMYSTGYGIRKAGDPTFTTNNIVIAGTEKPIAGAVTIV